MSFGSMSSANSSLKNNRSIRQKEGFKSNNRDVSKFSEGKTMLKFKKVSKEELEILRLKIIKKAKKERIQLWTITIILSTLILFGIYRLIF